MIENNDVKELLQKYSSLEFDNEKNKVFFILFFIPFLNNKVIQY